MDSFLYYTININEQISEITKIKVNVGEDVNSIIDRIKVREKVLILTPLIRRKSTFVKTIVTNHWML